jgi:hypothetical protein
MVIHRARDVARGAIDWLDPSLETLGRARIDEEQ